MVQRSINTQRYSICKALLMLFSLPAIKRHRILHRIKNYNTIASNIPFEQIHKSNFHIESIVKTKNRFISMMNSKQYVFVSNKDTLLVKMKST